MKKLFLIWGVFLGVQSAWGQSNFEEERKKMLQDFNNFKKETHDDFDNFRDSVLTDFENFKKLIWKEFEGFRTGGTFVKPKPRVITPIKPEDIPVKPLPLTPKIPKIIIKPKITIPEDDFSKRISPDFKLKLQHIIKTASRTIEVDFYDALFHFYYNPVNFSLPNISKESITAAVKRLSENTTSFQNEIDQWATYAQTMQLNDYGFFQLLKKTSLQMYQDRKKATLFVWYILNKVGFDCKLSYTKKEDLFLLLPSKYPLMYRFQYRIDGKRYYIFDFNPNPPQNYGGIYSYQGNLNGTYKLDFLITKAPHIKTAIKENKFKVGKTKEKIKLSSNISYIQFLSELPMLNYQAYYYMPMSKQAEAQLDAKITPFLRGNTTLQKVTFLLNFVQAGFPYKYDKEQFNKKERPQSSEEMLFYTKGDCEDHAALFSYLVLRYTNCEVLGILYKGHATTAVKFTDGRKINGCHLPAPYSDYVLCEPTCNVPTPVGYISKEYRGVVPEKVFKVYRLKNK